MSQSINPIRRAAENSLKRLSKGFPVVALTGPRQSGKTTLACSVFPKKPYRTLEDPETRQLALSDPRAFLAQFPDGAILDEIQRAPELFSYLQGVVDAKQQMGLFVITGSQQFGLLEAITQSLAGRVGLVELLPLSLSEIASTQKVGPHSLNQLMFSGGYPALYNKIRSKSLRPTDWFRAYVTTYIERDVRQVLGVRDLASFERFVRMCASRSGQLLNLQALASDCGISVTNARQWMSVLETSYVVRLLQPWHENFGKRLVKMPKLYFLDTGLLCWLLRIENATALATHAMRGPVFETWIVAEVLKHRLNQGLSPDIYFWRDNHGVEIDLLFEHKNLLHAVEMKSGITFSTDWLKGCQRFQQYANNRCGLSTVVFGGENSFETQAINVMSWLDFA
jgi:predicted AAA+ superfamily ATPase